MKVRPQGIVQSGPYRGQEYQLTGTLGLPGWCWVMLWDWSGRAEREMRKCWLEIKEEPYGEREKAPDAATA